MREDHDLSADKLPCYRKIQTLGAKGGLWVVRESVTGKTFVMRKLSRENREVYERLMSIRHPNVVRVLHVFSDKGTFYGVEEYVQGRSLFCILTQRGIFGSKVISVGEQILKGLSVLHKNGIIHRDIKPENVMMNEKGKVKLIDFHIARVFYGEKERDTMLKGTKGYASPEQFGYRQTDCLRYTQPGRIHGSDDGLMLKVISRFNDSMDLLWRKHSWKIPLTLHGRDFLVIPGNLQNSFVEKLDR